MTQDFTPEDTAPSPQRRSAVVTAGANRAAARSYLRAAGMQDADFDKGQKLHSIPAALGPRGALNVSSLLHVVSGMLVIVAGVLGHFHYIYWAGAAIFISLLTYQHLIVKPNDLSRVNKAFADTNGLASILFALLTITAILLG